MISFSRRQLARYAVNQLIDGQSHQNISKRLASVLVAGKKQNEAGLLIDDIAQELEDRGLLASAVITSAHPITASLRKEMAGQIKKAARVDEVVINEEIDKEVIGGVRVETANHAWDNTISRRLADIKGGI